MSMKRLTDERIAALIDIAPLGKTMFDIKSALIELQERRMADSEPAAVTGSQEFPDLKSEKSGTPATKFDNEYIRTRLQMFDDTDELVDRLLKEANKHQEEQNFAAEYYLKEAATSLCGMYADLKDFGNELIRLQERQKAVPVAPDEMTVETAYPEVQTNWSDAKYYTIGWNACRAAMLATAPKPENAND
ncbi:TPA: hypothetical protein N2G38_005158 [Salmonella enterica]|nr:hypothetical protein [Salmonella enterica]